MQALAQLEECRSIPDFNNYLAFIFGHGRSLPVEVRQSAGLLLKNNLRLGLVRSTPSDPLLFAHIRATILEALRLSERALRHTAGTCVATIAGSERGQFLNWPELPGALVDALDSGEASAIEGALDTVYKLYEEAPLVVEGEMPPGSGRRPSDVLIPRILANFGHPDPAFRALAISACNLAAGYLPKALVANMAQYVGGLFALAHDPSPAVRKAVCSGLVALTASAPEVLNSQLAPMIEYMLASTQDADEEVAVEACEFWSAYPESGLDVEVLRQYLPRLLPVLLKNMVYDEYDDEVAEAEAAEEEALSGRVDSKSSKRDRDADIRPHIRSGGAGGSEENGNEGEEEDEEEVSRWNLRKCSAAGLDMLSAAFGDQILPLLLPEVQNRLNDTNWRARESAILALGAVSEGCSAGLAQHLPGIVGAILPALEDPRPMVRAISCWAMMRYAKGLIERASQGDPSGLDLAVKGICARVADHNPKVQEAACGGVASLAEEAQEAALPYVPMLFSALGAAVQRYGRRSLRNAYDAVATVAERVPGALGTREGASLILPSLFNKLATLPDGDRDLLPLLECVSAVCPAAGTQLQTYAEAVFSRCVEISDRARAAASAGAVDKSEADEFVVCGLDAISGLVEGLGAGVESLVARSALREVVVAACNDEDPDVRQSGFALVGDLAGACPVHLKASIGDIVGAALANLQPVAVTQINMKACNNATWALGQLAVACSPEELDPFALPALDRLAVLLSAPVGGLPRSLVHNAAIALGRVAWRRPELVAPHAALYLGPWCGALRGIGDGKEKEHAFLGMCAVLKLNPDAGAGAFTALCAAVVSWREVTNEALRNDLTQLMRGYKAQLVSLGQWEAALASLTPAAANKLVEMCHL